MKLAPALEGRQEGGSEKNEGMASDRDRRGRGRGCAPWRKVELLVANVAPHGAGSNVEEGVACETQAFEVEHARFWLFGGLASKTSSLLTLRLGCTNLFWNAQIDVLEMHNTTQIILQILCAHRVLLLYYSI